MKLVTYTSDDSTRTGAVRANGAIVDVSAAGDTIHAWSEILDRAELPARDDLGALRVRTVATKDRACADYPHRAADGSYDPAVVLDFDYWVVVPRAVSMRR